MTASDRKDRPLTAQELTVCAAILAGETQVVAADRAGVAEITVRRWLKRPEIKAEMERMSREASEAAVRKLRGAMQVAVDALLDVARHGESESARVSAAREILSRMPETATHSVQELHRIVVTPAEPDEVEAARDLVYAGAQGEQG